MGLTIRGTLPDGTESVFTLPDSGPTSTVAGWRAAVEPAGYRFLELLGEGPSVPELPEDTIHVEIFTPGGEALLPEPNEPGLELASLAPDNTWLWAIGIAALVWMVTRK